MKTFTVGLNVAGHIQFVMSIPAKDFRSAAIHWSYWTGHGGPLFNVKDLTYFGWPIEETKEEALQRKSNKNPFQY